MEEGCMEEGRKRVKSESKGSGEDWKSWMRSGRRLEEGRKRPGRSLEDGSNKIIMICYGVKG
jgi:hypothetical protein